MEVHRVRSVMGAVLVGLCSSSLLGSGPPPSARAETPFMPSEKKPSPPSALRGAGTACGLVETRPGDPDWVMCTSDHILRSGLCRASRPGEEEFWYNKVFNPCYPTNRYFKLTPDSGTGVAFPMSALGVGTFDGLYLRKGVTFRLYRGSNDLFPVGEEMTGPMFISVDNWRDVNPAPDGLEPGTFFVNGGPGALGDHSIKIGAATEILEMDAAEADNERMHHTDKFTEDYVLRRGAEFDVVFKLSPAYGPNCHEIYFEAQPDFGGDPIQVPYFDMDMDIPEGEWGAKRVGDPITNGDKSKTVKIKVSIPPDAAIGKYTFKAFIRLKEAVNADDDMMFEKPVIILFNPWSEQDNVYMPSAAERNEYVLNEHGRVWRGNAGDNSPKDWRFAQFDKTVLKAALSLLDGASAEDRADPVFISRRLSAMVNSNDDGGVLEGRWSRSRQEGETPEQYEAYLESVYGGGARPWIWGGSDGILVQYDASGAPVKYGQCWVFGGVLTTCLRTLGIPSRPLTNFNSAHDGTVPPDNRVDIFYKREVNAAGNPMWVEDRERTEDSDWNYHVWCEAWMKRPDFPGTEGWQAVDSTPQETSDGLYQLGPAPQFAVLLNVGGLYDVAFVRAEVDADYNVWLQVPDGMGGTMDELYSSDTEYIGQEITTKAVGGQGRAIITPQYKFSARGGAGTSPTLLPESGIEVTFDPPASAAMGSDIVWTVSLNNTSAADHDVSVVIEGSARDYDGTYMTTFDGVEAMAHVAAGTTETVSLTIPASRYGVYTGVTRTFEASVGLEVIDTAEVFVDRRRTVLVDPDILVTLTPPGPIAAGDSTSAAIEYANPLGFDLTNVVLTYSAGGGLSIAGGESINIGTVPAGQPVSAAKIVTGLQPGTHLITVTLASDKLNDVAGYAYLEVFADCNLNGIDDALDVSGGASQDCNADGIPDECQTDCNGNGIPDDCDIAAGAEPDCDANGVPDPCDIAAGAVPDLNGNGVPDPCDPVIADCNRNGVADNLDIAGCTSEDCNFNEIPDECDLLIGISQDCNGNGVLDECDIVDGNSPDCNINLILDECELASGAAFDCDGNGTLDVCEVNRDCNANGLIDDCDLAAGTSLDANGNAIPDECEVPAACCFPLGNCQDLMPLDCRTYGGTPRVGESCSTAGCPGLPVACCLGDGTCADLSVSQCEAQGGLPVGFGPPFLRCEFINECPQACCFADGYCYHDIPESCMLSNATPQGPGTNCNNSPCEIPLIACCFGDQICLDLTAADCTDQGGTALQYPSSCAANECAQACCFDGGGGGTRGGFCYDYPPNICLDSGGTPLGTGTSCATDVCPEPLYACCFPNDGSCQDLTVDDCYAQGGTPYYSQECETFECPQACCFPEGYCNEYGPSDCTAYGGTPQGIGTFCFSTECVQPIQACCMFDGSCAELTANDCYGQGGSPLEFGSTCATAQCPEACCFVGEYCYSYAPDTCVYFGGTPQGPGTNCFNTTCPPTLEGCCFPDGSCADLLPDDCSAQGGTPYGFGVPCANARCTTACCLPDYSCAELGTGTCAAQGGTAYSLGSTCAGAPCQQACCFGDERVCQELVPFECNAAGGVPQGDGATCATAECPQACCFSGGYFCYDAPPQTCDLYGGFPLGPGTRCNTAVCPESLEACCLQDGSCSDLSAADCAALGGMSHGSGSLCASICCPQPPRACCLPDGSCSDLPPPECFDQGGTPLEPDSACATASCQPQACCLDGNTCQDMLAFACLNQGGAPRGAATTCASESCSPGCTAPVLLSARSVAAHQAGEFYVDLDISNNPANRASEPRSSGLRIFEFQFDQPVTSASVSVYDAGGAVGGGALTLTLGTAGPNSAGRIDLGAALPDRRAYTVRVFATTGPGCDGVSDLCAAALIGDFNDDDRVNAADKAELVGFVFQTIAQSNAKFDVQVGGGAAINVGDVGFWTGFFGNSAVSEPCPAP